MAASPAGALGGVPGTMAAPTGVADSAECCSSCPSSRGSAGLDAWREVADPDQGGIRQQTGSLQIVRQFADIAWPAIRKVRAAMARRVTRKGSPVRT